MSRGNIPVDAPVNQIHDWPSFFEQIRQRPAMWMGRKSLIALENFIGGIVYAEYFYDVPDDRIFDGFDFSEFEKWADEQFNPDHLSINSYHMARLKTNNEEDAFDTWMEWYDAYRTQTGKT